MPYKILIIGLSGSGKTTLAQELVTLLQKNNVTVTWLNADKIREEYNDWDFSKEGRLRQAQRMKEISNSSNTNVIIIDMIAPLPSMRDTINPAYLIWVDTIISSKYQDTDSVFVAPEEYSIRVSEKNSNKWANIIFNEVYGLYNI